MNIQKDENTNYNRVHDAYYWMKIYRHELTRMLPAHMQLNATTVKRSERMENP
jgi:hypothetical protein